MNLVYNSLLDVVGNNPLVKINLDIPAVVYAKMEYLNPSGSIKDRSTFFIIEKAEKENKIKPGGTIIEASSGNQGISTALIGALKGYKVIITTPEKTSEEKKKMMLAYGAEVIVCKNESLFDNNEGYYKKACLLYQTIPNSFMINQYYNFDNVQAHYHTTGKELYNQIGDKATHLFLAMGTSGTATGVGRYFKERNPNIKVIGVDAKNSYFSTKGNPKSSVLEGIGIPHEAPLYDSSVIDIVIGVSDEHAIGMLKILAKKYGFLVGGTSGAVFYALSQFNFTKKDVAVCIFTDSGSSYLSKNFY